MVIKIPKGKKTEIADWLTGNISKENVRWWFNGRIYGDKDSDGYISSQETIIVDATKEEEPMLTFVMLKWSSSE